MKLQKHQHPRQRRSNGLISPQLYKIIRIKSNHGHLHLRQHKLFSLMPAGGFTSYNKYF